MTFLKHKIESLALALLLLPLLLGACSSGGDEPGVPYDGDLSLLLRVSVLEPGNSGSRAGEYDFELPELDTEKLQTLRVIIVDISKETPTVAHNYPVKLNQPGNSYAVDLRFKLEFSTDYAVYLIGNEAGLPEEVQTTLKSIAEGTGYTTGTLENIILTTETAGTPIIDNTGTGTPTLIPMTEKFELTTIDMPESAPQHSTVTMEKNFFLTRAVSKFSFNFSVSDDYSGTNPVDIKSVKIIGLGNKEYLLPNGTTYVPDKMLPSNETYGGRLITEFNVPDDNSLGEYVFNLPENVTLFPHPNTLETNSYSPELYFTESLGAPGFKCSISFDGTTYLPPVDLPNLDILPRNTHVIVNITVGNNNSLRLTVRVMPWEPVYYEFDFTHNVAMAEDGALTFIPDTYASYDESLQRLVLNDYPNAVTGEFGISEPKGARWYAYLVTKTGELNSIQFVTTGSDGKPVYTPYITGIIDGQKTQFKVAATQSAGNQQRSALLQVMVTTDDGLSIPVNILKNTNPGNNIENVTFIQNPNN